MIRAKIRINFVNWNIVWLSENGKLKIQGIIFQIRCLMIDIFYRSRACPWSFATLRPGGNIKSSSSPPKQGLNLFLWSLSTFIQHHTEPPYNPARGYSGWTMWNVETLKRKRHHTKQIYLADAILRKSYLHRLPTAVTKTLFRHPRWRRCPLRERQRGWNLKRWHFAWKML